VPSGTHRRGLSNPPAYPLSTIRVYADIIIGGMGALFRGSRCERRHLRGGCLAISDPKALQLNRLSISRPLVNLYLTTLLISTPRIRNQEREHPHPMRCRTDLGRVGAAVPPAMSSGAVDAVLCKQQIDRLLAKHLCRGFAVERQHPQLFPRQRVEVDR
jgi:hypothetical protein